MKKLTPIEKKKLLAKMLELMVNMGLEIEPYMGLPLNKFNYENVEKKIEELKKDLEYVHSEY
jgi:hypothetical protein